MGNENRYKWRQPFYEHNRLRVLYGIVFYAMLIAVVNLYIWLFTTSDTTYVCI